MVAKSSRFVNILNLFWGLNHMHNDSITRRLFCSVFVMKAVVLHCSKWSSCYNTNPHFSSRGSSGISKVAIVLGLVFCNFFTSIWYFQQSSTLHNMLLVRRFHPKRLTYSILWAITRSNLGWSVTQRQVEFEPVLPLIPTPTHNPLHHTPPFTSGLECYQTLLLWINQLQAPLSQYFTRSMAAQRLSFIFGWNSKWPLVLPAV